MKRLKRSSAQSELDYKIDWHPEAVNELAEIGKFIFEYSIQGSENFVKKILTAVDSLQYNPERFQKDRELKDEFRRVIVSQYKVVFEIDSANKTVRVLSVWNTKWNPQHFLEVAKR